MSTSQEDYFKPDKESEKKAIDKFDNVRCIAEISIGDFQSNLLLFNSVTKDDNTDDWEFLIWITGKILFRAHFIQEMAVWSHIIRDRCNNDWMILYSIARESIDLANEMIAREMDINNEKDREAYRKRVYDIIEKHKKFMPIIDTKCKIEERIKNPISTDNLTFFENELRQFDDFFPNGKWQIAGYIISVSMIYYACKQRPKKEGKPPYYDILEHYIIKVIEGYDTNKILGDEDSILLKYGAYIDPKYLYRFNDMLTKRKRNMDLKLKHKWKKEWRTNKI